ncbi:suppressor of Mek1-like [Teleopsis dalmanni]|uniref:suppressor of Mek1-like n=1 Tax=Teleopsis dalmanni TaxID=139649 RepID=UPI0018CD476F|nr:suppressor of Mek1-like isoform X2 [Teleopsis dalmanni]XP_037945060.1 suppressor of Mek1-like [Teleopsis dalmanni]
MESKKNKKVSGYKNSKTEGANGQRLKGAGKFAEIEIRNVETDSSKESDATKKIESQKSSVSSKSKKSDLSDVSDEIVISEFKDKSSSSFEENERKNVNKAKQLKNSNNNNSTDDTNNKLDDYKFIALTKWVDIKDKPNLKDSVRQSFVNESSETDVENQSKNKKKTENSESGRRRNYDKASNTSYQANSSSNGTTHKSGDTSEDEDSQPYNNYLKQSCSLPTLTSLKAPNGIEKLKRQLMGKLLETAMCRRKSKWSFRRKCCKQPPPPLPVENLTKGCVIQQILHYNESDEDSCFSDTSEDDGSNASIHYNSPCCDSFTRHCSSNCSSRSSYSGNYGMQSECGQSPSYCPTYYNPYYCSGYCYPQCGNMCFNPYPFPMEASTNYCTNNFACPKPNKFFHHMLM